MSSAARNGTAGGAARPGGRMSDFLIIGAYKSGTTSLNHYLKQHPQIFMPDFQEPNYFAEKRASVPAGEPEHRYEERGYRRPRVQSLAAYQRLFTPAGPDQIVGECSPEYMRNPIAAGRIHEALPGVKLLAILRNPVERALSDYSMMVRDGLETADFVEAVGREPSAELFHHYVYTGYYGCQLQRYYDLFPREQIHVVLLEDLVADVAGTLAGIFAFLGVDPAFLPQSLAARNVSGRPENAMIATAYRLRRSTRRWLKPVVPEGVQRVVDGYLSKRLERLEMPEQTRLQLCEAYTADVTLLGYLLQRDLDGWLR